MRSSRGAPRSRAARRTRRSRSRRATRSPDPRRTRTRAQLVREDRVGGNGEEACVRTEPPRREEDVETFGRSGEISETSDNTHEAHDGDRRACALRERRLRRRTFGSRRPLPSSLKSCRKRVRTCGENGDAPSARAFPLRPLSKRTRIRLAPEQRQNLRGAEGRRGHGDRARTRPAVPSIRSTTRLSARRVTGGEASRHRLAPSYAPHTSRIAR